MSSQSLHVFDNSSCDSLMAMPWVSCDQFAFYARNSNSWRTVGCSNAPTANRSRHPQYANDSFLCCQSNRTGYDTARPGDTSHCMTHVARKTEAAFHGEFKRTLSETSAPGWWESGTNFRNRFMSDGTADLPWSKPKHSRQWRHTVSKVSIRKMLKKFSAGRRQAVLRSGASHFPTARPANHCKGHPCLTQSSSASSVTWVIFFVLGGTFSRNLSRSVDFIGFCQTVTQAIALEFEVRTSCVMRLFWDMLHSTKPTNFS